MFEQLISGFQAMSGWEYLAVVFGLLYLLLAMKQSLWCWPAGFAGTAIYTVLFWQGALLMESLLNFYYLIMAIYGWWNWRLLAQKELINNDQPAQVVISWHFSKHVKWITLGSITALSAGFYLDQYTVARFAYLDSFTTVFAVIATYLVTQKVLENWLYWIVIDLASIYLYLQAGYIPTAALFVIYSILAYQGYWQWKGQVKQENTTTRLVTDVD